MNMQLQGIGFNSSWNRIQMAAQSLNQSARRNTAQGQKAGEDRRQDRVQLSPMNQMQSRLESLMAQKQNIIEQKNQLIADTLDAGGDVNSIQSLISLYEEQVRTLDSQISQTMKDMVEDQLDKAEEEKQEKEPETKEELQRKQMNDLHSASMDYDRANQIYSAHLEKKRAASTLASEIELDGGRGGAAPGKQERLNELLQEADELYTDAMKGYVDLNVSLKETAEEASHRHELESEEEAKAEKEQEEQEQSEQ